MNKITKYFAIFAVFILLVIPQNANAATYSAGGSSPSQINVYATNSWSQEGYWDLRNEYSIPDSAIVTAAKLNWSICTSCGMNYTNTHVALFNQAKLGDWMDSGFYNYNFGNEPVKQIWSTKFQVTKVNGFGYITPILTLSWTDAASATSGTFMLNESPSNNLLVEEDKLDPIETLNTEEE